MTRYSTSFKHVGSAYDDSLVLLREWNKRGDWRAVVKAAYEENLLKKKSSKWIEMLLSSVKRRYFDAHPPLPEGRVLSKYLAVIDSNQAQIQTLYQYICASYPLVDQLVVDLVEDNLQKYNAFRLTKTIYRAFFSKEAEHYPELEDWADYTKERWRRDFYAFLRYSGLMEKFPSVLVRKFVIKPEAFAYFLYGLIGESLSPSKIFDSRLWKRYFLSYGDIEEKLSECQVRGWLSFRSMGAIIELIPTFNSLEEWIDAIK